MKGQKILRTRRFASRSSHPNRLTVPAMMSMLETMRAEAETDLVLTEFADTLSIALQQLGLLRLATREAMIEVDWEWNSTEKIDAPTTAPAKSRLC